MDSGRGAGAGASGDGGTGGVGAGGELPNVAGGGAGKCSGPPNSAPGLSSIPPPPPGLTPPSGLPLDSPDMLHSHQSHPLHVHV